MSNIKIICFSVSLDGYGAGPSQDLENPLGLRGKELHDWMLQTKTFRKIIGLEGGTEGIDDKVVTQSFENVGAWIIGRNMFGPIRGHWTDDEWKGWWGEEPPFHVPVFVLTHHKRESIEMKGGTVFHFVTDGITSAIERAREIAHGKDIRIGGGVSTLHQFLQAGYIDEIQLAFAPVFLGAGENLFSEMDLSKLGFNKIKRWDGEGATHITLTRE